jgi:hypothetical protein
MQHFPDRTVLLEMEPEELAPFILRFLMGPNASGNVEQVHFMQTVPEGALGERFMEAWMWLEREGLLAPTPGDIGDSRFVTRAGRAVVGAEDFEAFLKTRLFPQHIGRKRSSRCSCRGTTRPQYSGRSKKSRSGFGGEPCSEMTCSDVSCW